MSNLFQRLSQQAFRAGITPRTKESRAWFQKKASNLRSINREKLMQEKELRSGRKQIIGSMQMFMYDPKLKDELPYYDAFPLEIVVDSAPGGFYGLNIHYLPPILRAKFLDALMGIVGSDVSDRTKFELSYEMLKKSSKLRYFKPCFKHYLNEHVKSRFSEVPAPEWEIATFLPTADFRKANRSKVYYDSRQMV